MADHFIEEIRTELEQSIDPSPRRTPQSFFREAVKYHGVKAAVVERIAGERFLEIRHKTKDEIFSLCEALLKTDYGEEAVVAFDWAYRLRDNYVTSDFLVFESWLADYVNNWAKCDTLCNHTIAAFVDTHPQYVERLKVWATSDNRWVRRGAAVTLVLPARKGRFLKEVFEIADILLVDSDDLVRKGYGWMLKEASKQHLQEVFGYVMMHRDTMPRAALRYAIEKMPEGMRRQAMKRT
jgi:3-methyladenine DNA glycosylase AlkD